MLNLNISDIINSFKSKYCIECTHSVSHKKEIGNKDCFVTLPCNCLICSVWCLQSFIKRIIKDENNHCLCGSKMLLSSFYDLYKTSMENNLIDVSNYIQDFINFRFKSTCFICFNRFDLYSDEKIHRVIVDDEKLEKCFNRARFIHLVCNDCYKRTQSFKEKVYIDCFMCFSTHYIVKIEKNINLKSEENDDNCMIF